MPIHFAISIHVIYTTSHPELTHARGTKTSIFALSIASTNGLGISSLSAAPSLVRYVAKNPLMPSECDSCAPSRSDARVLASASPSFSNREHISPAWDS